jgi:hypothetical protein
MMNFEIEKCFWCLAPATVEVWNDCETGPSRVCDDHIDYVECSLCDSEILPMSYRYNK